MWFCMPCKPKIEKNIINEKSIEKRCEIYFTTLNARIEEIEKNYIQNVMHMRSKRLKGKR